MFTSYRHIKVTPEQECLEENIVNNIPDLFFADPVKPLPPKVSALAGGVAGIGRVLK